MGKWYVEASFTGILERNGISGWINQRDIYFHNLLGIKWHMQPGGNAVLSGQQKTTKRSGWTCYKGLAG